MISKFDCMVNIHYVEMEMEIESVMKGINVLLSEWQSMMELFRMQEGGMKRKKK